MRLPIPAARAVTPAPISLRWAKAFRAVLLGLVYVAVAAFALNSFQLKWGFRDGIDAFSLERQMDGTAWRPVVYRVLVPRVAAAVAPHLPQRLVDGLITHNIGSDDDPKRSSVLVRYGWRRHYFVAALVAYFVQFASLIVTLVASRALVRETLGFGRAFYDFAPAVGMTLLPVTYHLGGYVYDFPELAFCAVGLLALVRGRLTTWYACFVLACLNKEADVLLAAWFVIFWWRRVSFARLVAHGAVHVAIGATILLGLRSIYAGNAGASAQFDLYTNLASYVRASTLFGFVDYFAPFIPFPRPFNLLSLFVIGSAVAIGWREKPRELRWAFGVMMVLLLPLVVVTGHRDEVRNFSLAFVPFCLLACHTVHRVYTALGDPAPSPRSS